MSKKPKPNIANACYFAEARDYTKVVKAEFEFFKGLVDAKNNIPSSPSLQKTLKDVTGFLQDQWRVLNVVVEFSVNDPRSGKENTMSLGTLLKPPQKNSHAQVTHFLCLADADSLIAKMHCDFDFHPEAVEKKPSPHVQMGGRVFGSLLKQPPNKHLKVCWNDEVDKPRMPSLPICTALLWHWAFLEYQDNAQISKFLKAWPWQQLVRSAENAVLRPFFSDGMRLFENHPRQSLLDALYVPLSK